MSAPYSASVSLAPVKRANLSKHLHLTWRQYVVISSNCLSINVRKSSFKVQPGGGAVIDVKIDTFVKHQSMQTKSLTRSQNI